ncbi:MAG: nucleotidyltransferase family protein [Bacteroidetes bacterium]|nr:nucleotidyltransferase family protein [Bacteroidota bacterium]
MKAMIFAAGFGTRLKPLTDTCPKALVQVGNKPMLQHTIEHLIKHGVSEIIINIHYLGNQIIEFLQENNNFNIRIDISDETDLILETGGGLLKAQHFFDDNKPFLVCNADVFTNINLTNFFQFHQAQNAIATLAVRHRKSSRVLLFDEKNELQGWQNFKNEEAKFPSIFGDSAAHYYDAQSEIFSDKKYDAIKNATTYAFSGYQILSPEIFKHTTRTGIFSLVEWYIDICAQQKIIAYEHNEDVWIDIGSPVQLQKANAIYNSIAKD